MSKLVLLNPTIIGGAAPKSVSPGTIFDTVTQASDLAAVVASGGVLMPQGNAIVSAQQALAASRRLNKGSNENELALLMLAASAASLDTMQVAVAGTTSADLAEANAFTLSGAGTIVAAYFLPSATATYTGGNQQVLLLNIYDQTGTLVGQLASFTLGNGVAANQPTKWVRLSLGAITNPIFGDGYTVTLTSTHTGAITLAAGTLVLVTKPTY
jgi:hypothetical protein